METGRKITVEISSDLLEKAQRASGTGITQTVRTGLQLLAASRTYARLRQLRGKVRFTRTLAELKADRWSRRRVDRTDLYRPKYFPAHARPRLSGVRRCCRPRSCTWDCNRLTPRHEPWGALVWRGRKCWSHSRCSTLLIARDLNTHRRPPRRTRISAVANTHIVDSLCICSMSSANSSLSNTPSASPQRRLPNNTQNRGRNS
jgi:hypothetical protein